MQTKILALILAFAWMGVATGFAGEKVWVGLYLAENKPPPPEAQLVSEKMGHRLYTVFGFKYYELIKAEEIELGKEWDQWVMPRRDFFIRLKPLPRQPGRPRIVDYEIYQNGFIVARGLYQPYEEMPLFINGPYFKQGQFIFVLEAR